MIVRSMTPSDLDQVMKLLASWNIAPIQPSPEIPKPERSEIVVENTVVAEDGGRIVGVRSFILLSPTEAEGASLAVEASYHGRGIGRLLMRAGYRMMFEKGIRKVYAETDKPEVADWLARHYGHRIVGKAPKRHAFGVPGVADWIVLEIDLHEGLLGP